MLGNIGAEAVARAEPDGTTLLLATSSTNATNAALYRRLAFNPVRDFTPISQMAFVPNLLVVNPELPVNSLFELVAYAKAKPGQLNYGSGGSGSSLHLAAAVFAFRGGIDMVHVLYRGGAPVAADLVSGKLQLSFSPMVEVLQQVRAGKLRALGVTTARRSALLPDIPAIGEVIAGYEVALWNGLMGPAGLPAGGGAPRRGDLAISPARTCGASSSRARSPWAAPRRTSPPSSPPSSRNGRSWCASRAPPSIDRGN